MVVVVTEHVNRGQLLPFGSQFRRRRKIGSAKLRLERNLKNSSWLFKIRFRIHEQIFS